MDWLLECTVPLWLYIEAWWARPLAQSSFRIWILRSWMKKCDHSDSPSTGQRQCLTRATRLQLMATVFQVVESFPYLGCLIRCTGDNVLEIKRRVSITRDCMMALDRNIWRSCISVGTKLRLYNSCFLPIFLYGAETWSVTATAVKTFDALDQWCLRPHPEYTLVRAHHQQGGSIKNPTTITVWRSPLQTISLLWSHLQSWPQSGSFSGTVPQYYWSAQGLEEKTRPAETDQITNYWERSTATQSGSGDSSTTCSEQNRHSWKRSPTSLTSSRWWWWWWWFVIIVIITKNSAIADKPARCAYRSVKVTKHSTIPYVRYRFLLYNNDASFLR